jgi:excisionase family DNA binding protein
MSDSLPGFESLLNAADAARLLGGMHVKSLQRLARRKQIPAHKIGRHWYFRASEINQWLASSCTIGVKSDHRPCLAHGGS